ncbi:hypothetical protein [Chromobacterium sphagni]|uniref:hypothetical protein n=1 Tax=Chromobacterium sphagni TaxID=1903179 RepID=UPI0011133FF0|nr:hypothetical protein [Chromobacterium sphagni]
MELLSDLLKMLFFRFVLREHNKKPYILTCGAEVARPNLGVFLRGVYDKPCVVKGVSGMRLLVAKLKDTAFTEEDYVDLSCVRLSKVVFSRNFNGYNSIYVWWRYFLADITNYPCWTNAFSKCCVRVGSVMFNKKKIVSERQIKILDTIFSLSMRRGYCITVELVAEAMYGQWWDVQSDKGMILDRIGLSMSALCENGDLKASGAHYAITGKGIGIIEDYEEQERKHRSNLIIQELLVVIAFLALFMSAAQTQLIKFPTLIDWSGSGSKSDTGCVKK